MTTTGTSARSREAQTYLDGVGAALADLPDEERAELLDELAAHVDELTAESDAPLETRLGTPADYAAELRASAGLPPAGAPRRPFGRLRTGVQRWSARREVAVIRDFLTSLQPAWWVLRGWVVGAVAAHLTTSSPWDFSLLVFPGGFVGFWGTLAAVIVSVQMGRGRIALPWRRWREVLVAVNIGAALAVIPVLLSLSTIVQSAAYVSEGVAQEYVEVPPVAGVYANGTQVWNIYAYDAAGQLLHDVRLYDQDGAPLALGLSFDSTKKQTLDSGGQPVDNAFPYRYLDPVTGEVADPDAGPPITAPPLLGTATATPTATPTPTGSATPSPSATDGTR